MTREMLRREVYFKAVRSRGPGGQNVNKVSSAAVLYWNYLYSPALSDFQKRRIQERLAGMINAEGELYVRSDEFRDLEQNKTRCLDKVVDAVAAALFIQKKRRATKPTRGSQRRRLDSKTKAGETKKLRKRIDY